MMLARLGLVQQDLSGQIVDMEITRHFVTVAGRRMHYRRCGRGPALLMAHQSPRSSAEYAALMQAWGAHFTCIAPDTPGFGQSDPLPEEQPDIAAFGDALVGFMDALGLRRVAAYGFHSGGIILMNAVKRHPQRFSALAIGGYAIWTAEEMALFSDRYLPPFQPSAYGEHLTWLWNRMLEQSWFFPWFAVVPEYRLSVAHADVARVDQAVREMLEAGDAYRAGYGAVLRAPRDIPPPDAAMPPVLITAYDGDPLQAHIDRLGTMPAGWRAAKVVSPAAHQADSLAFLREHAAGDTPPLVEDRDRGFHPVTAEGFSGLIHWQGRPGDAATLPAPGRAADLIAGAAIDPPGHGLSDDWYGPAPTGWRDWQAILDTVAEARGFTGITPEPLPTGNPALLFPDLAPDRFGAHLTRAWAIVRAARLFDPWYEAKAANARAFDPAALAPPALARDHLALLGARSARAFLLARRTASEGGR
jgi:haloalkane dehalogenase